MPDLPPAETAATRMLADFRNRTPSDQDFAEIGRIAIQHTSLEFQLEALVWRYMGDIDKGHIATSQMGIQELTNVLKTLVEWTEPDDTLADCIEWGIECFHALRKLRNDIIHGFNFTADQKTGRLFIEARTRSVIFDSFQQFEITPQTLRQISGEQVILSVFLNQIDLHIESRGQDAIGHDKPPPSNSFRPRSMPPKPTTITPKDHEKPVSARRKRKQLLERQAREAKKKRRRGATPDTLR